MNYREESQKKIKEISGLIIDINEKNPFASFFKFHGHVGAIDVQIAKNKSEYELTLYKERCYGFRDATEWHVNKEYETQFHQDEILKLCKIKGKLTNVLCLCENTHTGYDDAYDYLTKKNEVKNECE